MHPLNEQTFERATSSLPAWARSLSEAGFDAFGSLAMPTSREEDWRYVEVTADLDAVGLPDGPGSPIGTEGAAARTVPAAGTALNVDGFTISAQGEGPGVLLSLADAFSSHPEALQQVYRVAGPAAGLDRFSAAHHAFGSDGVVLLLPRGTVSERPYLIEFHATTAGTLALPRLTVLAEDGSEGSAVLHLRSPDGVPLVAVPQIEILTGANASFGLTLVQDWGDQTYAVAQQRMVSGRDAALHLSEMGLGGSSARLHLIVDLEGRGSDARVLGLYFGDRRQTLDYRYFMNHRAPNTTSDMFLKGAVGDNARSVFTGMIRIEPEGQKTDAVQNNRNLVLSEGAQAHSVPNLEILANDVKCGHGSAVGPLDGDQRHYLMSRGLGREQADRLQVKGFFEDVLSRFPRQELEPPLREAVMAKYAAVMTRGL